MSSFFSVITRLKLNFSCVVVSDRLQLKEAIFWVSQHCDFCEIQNSLVILIQCSCTVNVYEYKIVALHAKAAKLYCFCSMKLGVAEKLLTAAVCVQLCDIQLTVPSFSGFFASVKTGTRHTEYLYVLWCK